MTIIIIELVVINISKIKLSDRLILIITQDMNLDNTKAQAQPYALHPIHYIAISAEQGS